MPFVFNSQRLRLVSIIVAVIVVLIVLAAIFLTTWPSFARQKLIDNLSFREGTLGYERFKTTADLHNLRLEIRVYNVTNVKEVVQSYAKLRLQEIGPFVYHEYKYKEILNYDEDLGLITYKLRREFTFKPELSVGDPTKMQLTWINVPVISAISAAEKLDFFRRATTRVILNTYMREQDEPPFITDTVDNLIFSGSYRKLFAALEKNPIVRDAVGKWPLPDNKFAILYNKNNTWNPDRDHNFTTAAGFGRGQTYRDLNQYRLMNGSSTLPYWNRGGHCNELRGSDGQFFSPFLNETSKKLDVYAMDICRRLSFKFRRTVTIQGIPVNEYTLDPRDLQSGVRNVENRCYCLSDDPSKCSLDGLIDLSKCASDDVMASLAHFLYGSPELKQRVSGLKPPDAATDEPIMHIEPNTGLSVQVKVPIQFNMKLTKSDAYGILQFFKEANPLIIPLLTVTEAAELEPDQASQLRTKLLLLDSWFIVMVLGGVTIFLLVVVTIIAIVCAKRRGASEAAPLLPRRRTRSRSGSRSRRYQATQSH